MAWIFNSIFVEGSWESQSACLVQLLDSLCFKLSVKCFWLQSFISSSEAIPIAHNTNRNSTHCHLHAMQNSHICWFGILTKLQTESTEGLHLIQSTIYQMYCFLFSGKLKVSQACGCFCHAPTKVPPSQWGSNQRCKIVATQQTQWAWQSNYTRPQCPLRPLCHCCSSPQNAH